MNEENIDTDYLLTCISEEGSEVSQAACKSIRFGLSSTYTGTENRKHLLLEFYDLWAVIELLQKQGDLPTYDEESTSALKELKKAKIFKNYLRS